MGRTRNPSPAKLERDKALKGRPRRTLNAAVRARHRPCAMCGHPIDQTRDRQRDPLGSVIDEWVPRHTGGSATDPTNCVELHRLCNGIKSGHWPVTQELRDRCRTQVDALLTTITVRTW